MNLVLGPGLRIAAALSVGLVALAGLVLAVRGGDPGPKAAAETAAATSLPATPSPAPAATATRSGPEAAAPSPSPEATQPPPAPLAAAAPPTPPPPPQPPLATPAVASQPSPARDLPKYTDVAVLALAAGARLPSGLTFRECVERAPSQGRWPTPVHLYYQGAGHWMVETHISEVQVVFDEATETFAVGNFQPTNPGCR